MFFRANRKQIINLNFIDSIHAWPNGGYLVKLRGGFEVTMSAASPAVPGSYQL